MIKKPTKKEIKELYNMINQLDSALSFDWTKETITEITIKMDFYIKAIVFYCIEWLKKEGKNKGYYYDAFLRYEESLKKDEPEHNVYKWAVISITAKNGVLY